MTYHHALGLSVDVTSGAAGTVQKCVAAAGELGASKADVEAYAKCASDAYCAAYKIPAGVCSSVAGPIAGAVYEFFDDIFGPHQDCSTYRPIMVNGRPADPCAPCAGSWYMAKYGIGGLLAQSQDCEAARAAGKAAAPDILARKLCFAEGNDFLKRFAALADDLSLATLGETTSSAAGAQAIAFWNRIVQSVRPPDGIVQGFSNLLTVRCSADNGGPDAILHMGANAALIKDAMIAEYRKAHPDNRLLQNIFAAVKGATLAWVGDTYQVLYPDAGNPGQYKAADGARYTLSADPAHPGQQQASPAQSPWLWLAGAAALGGLGWWWWRSSHH